jgi:hypothetical protein
MKKYLSKFFAVLTTVFFVFICSLISSETVKAESTTSYIGEADEGNITESSIKAYGYSSTRASSSGNTTTIYNYNNTSYSDSCYVVISNNVVYNGERYDLVMYPWVSKSSSPCYFYVNKTNGYTGNGPYPGGYTSIKLFVTKHDDINSPIDWSGLMVFSDLDAGETVIFPSGFQVTHLGSHISQTNIIITIWNKVCRQRQQQQYKRLARIQPVGSMGDCNDTKRRTDYISNQCIFFK